MLIRVEKVHINQLVRLWDQRHIVVVLDHLVFLYLLFTSQFNFQQPPSPIFSIFSKVLNTPYFIIIFFFTLQSFEKSSKNYQRNYSIINSNLVESFFVWLNEILTANDVLTSKSIIKILELSRFQFNIGGFEQERRKRQHIISRHLKSSTFDEKNKNTARVSHFFGTFLCPHFSTTVKFPLSRFINGT